MSKGVLFLLPVVSALLLTFSFPPFDLGMLAWCGLAPLLFALRQQGPRAAAGLAFVFGFLFVVANLSWVHHLAIVSPPSRFFFLTLVCLYFPLFGFLYRLIYPVSGPWIIVGTPALWVALEYVRSNLFFLSWPWNLLGHSQYRYLPVIQIADVAGVYGVSFLIVMVNQCLSQVPDLFALRREVPTLPTGRASGTNCVVHILLLALALGLTFSYGWHKLATPKGDEHLRVALIQANIRARDNMPPAEQMKHLRTYERLTREAAREKPDLIVWPASSLPAPFDSSLLVHYVVSRLAHEVGAYLLVGGAGYDKSNPRKEGHLAYSNSEFLVSPYGLLMGQYNKIRLLPFNEYLPLQGMITWPQWITTLRENFMAGEAYTLFQLPRAKFAAPVCWENMFPELFRRFVREGAQFMVSVTNEEFFGRTSGPYQTLAMNVFRAVENRVAIVRAATTGVSGFINPDGEIVERIRDGNGEDLFVAGILVRDVLLSNHKTFYTVYGDIFAYAVICTAASIILACLSSRNGRALT